MLGTLTEGLEPTKILMRNEEEKECDLASEPWRDVGKRLGRQQVTVIGEMVGFTLELEVCISRFSYYCGKIPDKTASCQH